MALVNETKIKIQWGDCDPAGIVYFPRYFEYFDNCTHALFERAGLAKPDMLRHYGILGIPMVDAHAKFLAPSSFGDEVTVKSAIANWGKTSFNVEHKLFRGGELAVEGFEIRVWTVRDANGQMHGVEIPEDVKQKFAPPR